MNRQFQRLTQGIKAFCSYFQVTQTPIELATSALGALSAGALVQNLQDISEEGTNTYALTFPTLAAAIATGGWLLSVWCNQRYFRSPQYEQRETRIEAVAREVMRATAGVQIMQRIANGYRYHDFVSLAYIPAHFIFAYGVIWGQHQEMLSGYDGSILPWRRRSNARQNTSLIREVIPWVFMQSIDFLFWYSIIDLSSEVPLSVVLSQFSRVISAMVVFVRYLPIFWGQEGCKLPTRLFCICWREHLFGEFSDHWQRAAVREGLLFLIKPLWIMPVYQLCVSPRNFSMLIQQGGFFSQGLAGSVFFLMSEKRVSPMSRQAFENEVAEVNAQEIKTQNVVKPSESLISSNYKLILKIICFPCGLALAAIALPFGVIYALYYCTKEELLRETGFFSLLIRGGINITLFATRYEALLSLSGSLGAGVFLEGFKKRWEGDINDGSDIIYMGVGGVVWVLGILSNYLHRRRPLYQDYSRERWIETLARELLKITVGGQIMLGGFEKDGIVAAYIIWAFFIYYGIFPEHDLELKSDRHCSFLPRERRGEESEHNELALNPYSKKDICIWLLDRIVEISIGFSGKNRINEDKYIPKLYTTTILTVGSFWIMRTVLVGSYGGIFYADSEAKKVMERLLPRHDWRTVKELGESSYFRHRLMIAIPMNVLGFLIFDVTEALSQYSARNMIGWREGLYFIQGLACVCLFASHEIKRKPRIQPLESGGENLLQVTIMPPPREPHPVPQDSLSVIESKDNEGNNYFLMNIG